jgi:predicted O-methyltransferase YrrM
MLKRIRHWSPRYVRDRLSVMTYERQHPEAPWLTPQIIEILDTWLRPEDIGVEWGSGRSTLWLGSRVADLTTIEDNSTWADRVEGMIFENKLHERIHLKRAPLSKADHIDPAASPYVEFGREIVPSSLDFALVDGALRDHCAAVAIDKLKPGGTLIIDNVERYIPRAVKSHSPVARGLYDVFETAEWECVFGIIKSWRHVWTTNGVSDTALWVKP